MTEKEALELALDMLERDNLKVGNIYVNYDIQKALIKLVKKERKKKEWQGLTDEEMSEAYNVNYSIYKEHVEYVDFVLIYRAIEAKLKEKNT